MKARIISLCLVLCLAFSLASPAAAALEADAVAAPLGVTDADIEAARRVVEAAVSGVDIFEDEFTTIVNIFNGFFTAAKVVSGITGAASSTISFLKLIGVMKDQNAENMTNILYELENIRDTLTDMERKLDNITDTMNKMEAETAFRDRAQDAILYNGVWRDFSYRYMEDGLDKLMTEYNAMLLDGLRSWCRNQGGARNDGGVDNTQLTLYYNPSEEGYELIFTAENGIPEGFSRSGRWVRIPASALPESMVWNVNTYRAQLEDYIADSLRGGSFESGNYPAFDGGSPTEEEILRTASEAVDLLSYRIACVQVDKNTSFALNVKRQFENYCTHLTAPGDGLSAILNTYFLTHAFEFEIKDDLMTLCDSIILKAGTYGTFVSNVLGMSGSVTDAEKLSAVSTLCSTLKELGRLKEGCVTEHDRFCYITNTEISISEVKMNQYGVVYTTQDGSVGGYKDYVMTPTRVVFPADWRLSAADLIGDANALLILYTLQSNGLTLNDDFAREHLFDSGVKDYGRVITSLSVDENLSIESGQPVMMTNKVIGDYFTTGQAVYLNRLPGEATTSEMKYHRRTSGSVIDLSTGGLATGRSLLATAVYGESRWNWWNDESAFFGGPADDPQHWITFETVCTRPIGIRTYEHLYQHGTAYNCLISTPLPIRFGMELNDFFTTPRTESVHEWDEGTVITAPTCTEPGVIVYRAVDDPLCIREEALEPLGHEWDEGVVIREPGEATAGRMQYTCLRDPGHTCTETIDPEGGPPEETTVGIEGLYAVITGDFDGLYARVSLDIQRNGESGLFLTQGDIREGGIVDIPDFRVPGVVVRGVSVALVRSLDDITSPSPDVVASDFEIYG